MERTEKIKQAIDCLLTRDEVAALLKVNLCTLHEWDKRNTLCPTRIGRKVFYKVEDIEKFLKI